MGVGGLVSCKEDFGGMRSFGIFPFFFFGVGGGGGLICQDDGVLS